MSSSIKKQESQVHNLARKPAPRPNPRPKENQDPRDKSQQRADPAQERRRPLIGHGIEHAVRDEGEDAAEHVAAEGLGRQGGTRVAVVRVREVVEHGEVDGEDAHGGAGDGQGGQDPVQRGERGPAEPEEADGHEGAFDAAEVQPAFGRRGHLAVVPCDLCLTMSDVSVSILGYELSWETCLSSR